MATHTTNFNLSKPDPTDTQSSFISEYCNNMDIIDEHLGQGGGGSSVSWQQLQVTGDKIATITVSGIPQDVFAPNSQTFTMAISRANINSDEKYSTIFGKIKKWFADLKAVAFSGSYNDLSNTPTKVSDFTNDSGFVTSTVNNLANYYLKSETYTQAQVDALIGAISTISIEVVQSLPTQDIKTNTIYLVPKQTAGTQNVYDEYIYVNNAWELIGDTEIDLSNYVTTTDLATALQDYVTSTGLSTILANYYTSSQIDTLLGGKVNDVEVNGTSVVNGQGVAEVTVPTKTSDLNNNSGFLDSSDITVTQVVSTGTKIATIDVGGTSTDLYAPAGGGGSVNDVTVNGTSVVNAQGVAEVTAVQDNPTFTEAQTRANIASGESFATILGKIKKFFTDLKAVAFSGSYNDLSDKPTIPDISTKVSKSGDTMTGELEIRRATGVDAQFRSTNTTSGEQISFGWGSGGINRGIWDTQFSKWIFRSTGTDVTVNGSTVPANKTLASTDQIPTDFVSKSSGGTFTGTVNVQTSNQTPLRNKTTASNAVCYLEFSNGDGYLGWFAVSAGKKPCFQSASDNVLRELATTSDLNRLTNYYSSRPASCDLQLGDGTVRYFVATSSMSTGKPTEGDAHILHLAWDNSGGWDGQLALPTTDSKHMQWRTQTNGTWGGWKTIIDSDGGTITGALNVNHSMSIYSSSTDTVLYLNTSVRSGECCINFSGITTGGSSVTLADMYVDQYDIGKKGVGTVRRPLAYRSEISSKRYKENISPVAEDEAKKILDVEIVNFDYKEEYEVVAEKDRCGNMGVIAEDVAEFIPKAVSFADIDGEQLPDGINYTKFIPYLIKMVQMQQKEIDELKAMIKEK